MAIVSSFAGINVLEGNKNTSVEYGTNSICVSLLFKMEVEYAVPNKQYSCLVVNQMSILALCELKYWSLVKVLGSWQMIHHEIVECRCFITTRDLLESLPEKLFCLYFEIEGKDGKLTTIYDSCRFVERDYMHRTCGRQRTVEFEFKTGE